MITFFSTQFTHHLCTPLSVSHQEGSFQATTSLISPSSMTKVCGIFSDGALLSDSERQTTEVEITYIISDPSISLTKKLNAGIPSLVLGWEVC